MSMNMQLAQELERLLNTLQQTEAVIVNLQPKVSQTTVEVDRIVGNSQKGIDKEMTTSLANAIHALAEAKNAVAISTQSIARLRASI